MGDELYSAQGHLNNAQRTAHDAHTAHERLSRRDLVCDCAHTRIANNGPWDLYRESRRNAPRRQSTRRANGRRLMPTHVEAESGGRLHANMRVVAWRHVRPW